MLSLSKTAYQETEEGETYNWQKFLRIGYG